MARLDGSGVAVLDTPYTREDPELARYAREFAEIMQAGADSK